jgi:aminopeptidase O
LYANNKSPVCIKRPEDECFGVKKIPYSALDQIYYERTNCLLLLQPRSAVPVAVAAGGGWQYVRYAGSRAERRMVRALIGARDWTEEWLSEGFATFAEDAIHAAAMEVVIRFDINSCVILPSP